MQMFTILLSLLLNLKFSSLDNTILVLDRFHLQVYNPSTFYRDSILKYSDELHKKKNVEISVCQNNKNSIMNSLNGNIIRNNIFPVGFSLLFNKFFGIQFFKSNYYNENKILIHRLNIRNLKTNQKEQKIEKKLFLKNDDILLKELLFIFLSSIIIDKRIFKPNNLRKLKFLTIIFIHLKFLKGKMEDQIVDEEIEASKKGDSNEKVDSKTKEIRKGEKENENKTAAELLKDNDDLNAAYEVNENQKPLSFWQKCKWTYRVWNGEEKRIPPEDIAAQRKKDIENGNYKPKKNKKEDKKEDEDEEEENKKKDKKNEEDTSKSKTNPEKNVYENVDEDEDTEK